MVASEPLVSREHAAQPVGANAPQVAAEAPVAKTRRRLFTKYVALFVAVVCIALVSNGVFDVFFYYQEHKASLIRIQREQAEAAAAKIKRMIGILSLGGVSNLAPGDLLSECIKSVSAHH